MKTQNVAKITDNEKNNYLTAFKNFEEKIEGKIEDMFHRLWHSTSNDDENAHFFDPNLLTNHPRMDLIDKDKEILVTVELPGIKKKDLDISITERLLMIKAKAYREKKEKDGNYLKQEINKKEYYRSTLLPVDVDESKIKTTFKNGILKIVIPKKKSSYRKKIKVE